jgi:hypothetical protein
LGPGMSHINIPCLIVPSLEPSNHATESVWFRIGQTHCRTQRLSFATDLSSIRLMSDILPLLARGRPRRSDTAVFITRLTQRIGFHGAAVYLKIHRLSQPCHDSRVLSLVKWLTRLIVERCHLNASKSHNDGRESNESDFARHF